VVEQAYDAFAQSPDNHLNFIIRTDGPASPALLQMLRPQVFAVDRDQPVSGIKALNNIVAGTVERQRFATTLLSVFSVVALVIAAVGIFGVMAYAVSQRTSEIGIRMALGASRGNVLRMILGQGMFVVLLGIGAGLVACVALTRVMQSMLYNLNARDPLTFALIAIGFTLIALLACLLPALRATKVDPLVALRSD
jgi:putative ABC transport system permease protein